MSRRPTLRQSTSGQSAIRRSPAPRKRDRVGPPIPGLKADVEQYAQHLQQQYVEAHQADPAQVFRQVSKHLRRLLLPHKRRGAMPRPEITRAFTMWRAQQKEKHLGHIPTVSWLPIYIAAIPGFASLSEEARKKAIRRLRNAVYNRAFSQTPQGRRRPRKGPKAQDLASESAEPDPRPSSGLGAGAVHR